MFGYIEDKVKQRFEWKTIGATRLDSLTTVCAWHTHRHAHTYARCRSMEMHLLQPLCTFTAHDYVTIALYLRVCLLVG